VTSTIKTITAVLKILTHYHDYPSSPFSLVVILAIVSVSTFKTAVILYDKGVILTSNHLNRTSVSFIYIGIYTDKS